MNKERLLKVVEALKDVPVKAFEMIAWAKSDSKGECKTAACAAGHYCIANPDADLFLRQILFHTPVFELGLRSDTEKCDFEAAAEHFDITEDDAEFIFDPGSYEQFDEDGTYHRIAKSVVMDRITAFVESGGER